MTTSLIIGIVIIAIALLLYCRSARKQSRRLDDLHITGTDNDKG
jgi:hypothetical protein